MVKGDRTTRIYSDASSRNHKQRPSLISSTSHISQQMWTASSSCFPLLSYTNDWLIDVKSSLSPVHAAITIYYRIRAVSRITRKCASSPVQCSVAGSCSVRPLRWVRELPARERERERVGARACRHATPLTRAWEKCKSTQLHERTRLHSLLPTY